MFAIATAATVPVQGSDATAIDDLQSRISKLEALLTRQTRTIELLQDSRSSIQATIPRVIVARSDSTQPILVKKDNGATYLNEVLKCFQLLGIC